MPGNDRSRPGEGGSETIPAKVVDHSLPTAADRSPLRHALDTAIAEANGTKLSMKDLTVLALQNDPFRIDTPAARRDGEWLAIHADRLIPVHKKIHLRGLHYILVTDEPIKPNGESYRNTDADWAWLQEKAADAARWLGYIPFGRIIDKRNDAPSVELFEQPSGPWPYLSAHVHVDIPEVADIKPRVGLGSFTGVQPYKIVMVGEKSSLEEALGPIANRHNADLYLPTGEMSDTLIYQMAKIGADDGRPMVVFYFSDCDPAGWQMPISVARKLQALQIGFFPDLDVQLHRVALTPDQVREYGLPSTPLKDTEKRGDAWQAAMGVEQTEIDALASLRPDLLRQLARDAIKPFFDSTLDARAYRVADEWRREAQAVVDNSIDQEQLDHLRVEFEAKLAELRSEIDSINDALRIDLRDFDVPPVPPVPEPELAASNGLPLLDSGSSFADQCKRLIDSKAYRLGGGS